MKCAIMQPTYLPWAGYFNLISQVDAFVFLDDAQFQKNSWHNRNRILLNQKSHWISVPIKHNSLGQKINETKIVYAQPWCRKHSKLLQQVYSNHPFSKAILDCVIMINQGRFDNLSDLNTNLILWFLEKLNITTKIYFSSQINTDSKRTSKIIQILDFLGADTYLSPKGAREYLYSDNFSDLTLVKLDFQEFVPEIYKQYRQNTFIESLSIVDVVANIGWKSARLYVS
jgi:hypothetical protein